MPKLWMVLLLFYSYQVCAEPLSNNSTPTESDKFKLLDAIRNILPSNREGNPTDKMTGTYNGRYEDGSDCTVYVHYAHEFTTLDFKTHKRKGFELNIFDGHTPPGEGDGYGVDVYENQPEFIDSAHNYGLGNLKSVSISNSAINFVYSPKSFPTDFRYNDVEISIKRGSNGAVNLVTATLKSISGPGGYPSSATRACDLTR